jgi:hypothetical protein
MAAMAGFGADILEQQHRPRMHVSVEIMRRHSNRSAQHDEHLLVRRRMHADIYIGSPDHDFITPFMGRGQIEDR